MKKWYLLFLMAPALIFVGNSCNHECECVAYDENGNEKYVNEEQTTGECEDLNREEKTPTGSVLYIYCDGTKPEKKTADNVIYINNKPHTFDENSATETDTSICLNFFEEHPDYMTVGWGTICIDKNQVGNNILLKDLKNFSFGWFKDPAGGYNEENACDIHAEDCTDGSSVTITKDNATGNYTAELNITTKAGQTIRGRVICKGGGK